MPTSNWPLKISGSLGQHIPRLRHLIDIAQRDTHESPWYVVYNHVLMFMATRNETDDAPLYVWPQCSLIAKIPNEENTTSQVGPTDEPSQAGPTDEPPQPGSTGELIISL